MTEPYCFQVVRTAIQQENGSWDVILECGHSTIVVAPAGSNCGEPLGTRCEQCEDLERRTGGDE